MPLHRRYELATFRHQSVPFVIHLATDVRKTPLHFCSPSHFPFIVTSAGITVHLYLIVCNFPGQLSYETSRELYGKSVDVYPISVVSDQIEYMHI